MSEPAYSSPARFGRTSLRSRFANEETRKVPPVVSRADARAAAAQALTMLQTTTVFTKASVAMGPLVTDEFGEALVAIGQSPPTVFACCDRCGYHVVKWELNQQRGAVQPSRRANANTTPGWEGNAWQDAANKDKGRISTGGAASDGLGTQDYQCKCGRNIPVKGERRMELYLAAIARGERKIVI